MMTDEDVISMVEPKQKLKNLADHMVGADTFTCDFGKFLADYMNDELVPMGFLMGCELALHDLKRGTNGYTGEPIANSLAGQEPVFYTILRVKIPQIGHAVLPPDFAKKVSQEFLLAIKG